MFHIQVAGSLLHDRVDECVFVILVLLVGGCTSAFKRETRVTPKKMKKFDSTLGLYTEIASTSAD